MRERAAAPRLRVLARLTSLAQIGELARRLANLLYARLIKTITVCSLYGRFCCRNFEGIAVTLLLGNYSLLQYFHVM